MNEENKKAPAAQLKCRVVTVVPTVLEGKQVGSCQVEVQIEKLSA